jgi:hypothetical protein
MIGNFKTEDLQDYVQLLMEVCSLGPQRYSLEAKSPANANSGGVKNSRQIQSLCL